MDVDEPKTMKDQTNKWQEDDDFMRWVYDMKYAQLTDKGPKLFVTLGCVLYMHEAYCEGYAVGFTSGTDAQEEIGQWLISE